MNGFYRYPGLMVQASGVTRQTHATAQACGNACILSASCKSFTFIPDHPTAPCLLREAMFSKVYDDGTATAFAYIKSRLLRDCTLSKINVSKEGYCR